jgi:orotate phosphoribosyltransferase
MDQRLRLIDLLVARSAQRGSFTLASGKKSDLYIDCRPTTMHPEGLSLIGPLGLHAIGERGWHPDSIGGLTLGADPVSYAIAYASQLARLPIRAFTVRKEAKTHGTGKVIEGAYVPGDRVVVIEDVITSGGSALRAAESVQAAGGTVVGILAVVDREEGGRAAIEAAGFEVAALVTAKEIVAQM